MNLHQILLFSVPFLFIQEGFSVPMYDDPNAPAAAFGLVPGQSGSVNFSQGSGTASSGLNGPPAHQSQQPQPPPYGQSQHHQSYGVENPSGQHAYPPGPYPPGQYAYPPGPSAYPPPAGHSNSNAYSPPPNPLQQQPNPLDILKPHHLQGTIQLQEELTDHQREMEKLLEFLKSELEQKKRESALTKSQLELVDSYVSYQVGLINDAIRSKKELTPHQQKIMEFLGEIPIAYPTHESLAALLSIKEPPKVAEITESGIINALNSKKALTPEQQDIMQWFLGAQELAQKSGRKLNQEERKKLIPYIGLYKSYRDGIESPVKDAIDSKKALTPHQQEIMEGLLEYRKSGTPLTESQLALIDSYVSYQEGLIKDAIDSKHALTLHQQKRMEGLLAARESGTELTDSQKDLIGSYIVYKQQIESSIKEAIRSEKELLPNHQKMMEELLKAQRAELTESQLALLDSYKTYKDVMKKLETYLKLQKHKKNVTSSPKLNHFFGLLQGSPTICPNPKWEEWNQIKQQWTNRDYNPDHFVAELRDILVYVSLTPKSMSSVPKFLTKIAQNQREFLMTLYGSKNENLPNVEKFNGSYFGRLVLALMKKPYVYLAEELKTAIAGTDKSDLIEILLTNTKSALEEIKEAYKDLYRVDLCSEIASSNTSGDFQKVIFELCEGRDDANHANHADPEQVSDTNDAESLYHGSPKKSDTDKKTFVKIFTKCNFAHLRAVIQRYEEKYGKKKPIEKMIKSEFSGSGSTQKAFLAIIEVAKNRGPASYFATRLTNALTAGALKTFRGEDVTRIIVSRSEIDLGDIKTAYSNMYGKSLENAIKSKAKGDYMEALVQIVQGNGCTITITGANGNAVAP